MADSITARQSPAHPFDHVVGPFCATCGLHHDQHPEGTVPDDEVNTARPQCLRCKDLVSLAAPGDTVVHTDGETCDQDSEAYAPHLGRLQGILSLPAHLTDQALEDLLTVVYDEYSRRP